MLRRRLASFEIRRLKNNINNNNNNNNNSSTIGSDGRLHCTMLSYTSDWFDFFDFCVYWFVLIAFAIRERPIQNCFAMQRVQVTLRKELLHSKCGALQYILDEKWEHEVGKSGEKARLRRSKFKGFEEKQLRSQSRVH